MKTVVPIILFVAVAGFHSVVSMSLGSTESNESSEERVSEEHTTPTQLEPQKHGEMMYEAAHVKDTDRLAVNHTEEGNENNESEGGEVLGEENTDDGENEALTCTTEKKEENTGNESAETDYVGDYYEHTTVLEHDKEVDDSVESEGNFSDYDEEAGFFVSWFS